MAINDSKIYADLVDLAAQARARDVIVVCVFKPGACNDEDLDLPDIIVSSVADPKIIAAMLGNWPWPSPQPPSDDVEQR